MILGGKRLKKWRSAVEEEDDVYLFRLLDLRHERD